MRSSCIRHPEKEPLIIVRAWQIAACDDNRCAASLLSFFEYWHDIKLQMASKSSRQNEIAIAHGDSPTQDETLLQFHNEQELEAGILGFYGTSSIRKAIALLKEKDFISVHANPNNRYKFDQTRYFLFHDEQVNQWLEKHLSSDPSKVTDRGVEITNEAFNLPNDLYTETTPENKSKSFEAKDTSPSKDVPRGKETVTTPQKQTGKLSKADCDRFVVAWNEAKPAVFCGLEPLTNSKLGDSRRQFFQSMVKEAQSSVDLAIAAFQSHLRSLDADSYWQFPAKLENVASKNKLSAAVQSYCTSLKTPTIAHSAETESKPPAPTQSELLAEAQKFIDLGWIEISYTNNIHLDLYPESKRLIAKTAWGRWIPQERWGTMLEDLARDLKKERANSGQDSSAKNSH